ncbi:hypothetical protein C8R44DRAFT_833175 [Mycena epipterygia]|nr:hypothetical protein C8R44DRAFT_833175 [Mycena epipterygia]
MQPGPSSATAQAEPSSPNTTHPADHLSDDNSHRITETHPTAGKVIRMHDNLHAKWKRSFGLAMDGDGDVEMGGPDMLHGFAPFASELDWKIAEWVVKDGPGHKAFDRLLDIPGVREKLGLSYSNIRGLHQIIDEIPERAAWTAKLLSFPDRPHETYTIRYRDPLDAIRSLLGNPAHAKDIVYAPKRIFSSKKKDNRVYNEMWTGQWWTAIQVCKLPRDAALAPVIIATDKTQLTQFSGSKSAYPVYLTFGNLPKALRRRPTQNACILLGYLSVDKITRQGLSKQTNLMSPEELDARICALPPAFGIRHFVKGISPLSQISGTHDDGTLACMTDALKIWHENRDYFITAGVRNDFNIPKFHSLIHYVDSIRFFGTTDNYNTEMFERPHIDFAKNGWRASNRRDEFPQMIAWLGRQEKIASFSTYQAWLDSTRTPAPPPEYLNQFGNRLPPAQLRASTLPFTRLDVHHNFKFEPTSLDPASEEPGATGDSQTVIARPANATTPARFDTVIVRTSGTGEATGLTGMRVGRVRVLFKLPDTLSNGAPAPAHWMKHHLAYIEWFSSFKPTHEKNHHILYAYQSLW